MIGCLSAISTRIVSSVEYVPPLVFLGFPRRFSLSKRTSPICFGEDTLRLGSPASSLTVASLLTISVRRVAVKSFSEARSTFTPLRSILDRTRSRGSSISEYNLLRFFDLSSSDSSSASIWRITASLLLSEGESASAALSSNKDPMEASFSSEVVSSEIPSKLWASTSTLWLFSGSKR